MFHNKTLPLHLSREIAGSKKRMVFWSRLEPGNSSKIFLNNLAHNQTKTKSLPGYFLELKFLGECKHEICTKS